MVRPREFDEQTVLERALMVFWRRGYDAASIADLVDATGIQRQSLYNAFTDKHGLFRAALAEYVARVAASLAPLERADAGLAEMGRYMEGVLAMQRAEGVGACLLVKTAFGPASADPNVRGAIEAGAGLVRERFRRVLAAAEARGERAGAVSPVGGAALLYTVLSGLGALVATGGDGSRIAAILAVTLVSVGGAPGGRARAGRNLRGGGRPAGSPPRVRSTKKGSPS